MLAPEAVSVNDWEIHKDEDPLIAMVGNGYTITANVCVPKHPFTLVPLTLYTVFVTGASTIAVVVAAVFQV